MMTTVRAEDYPVVITRDGDYYVLRIRELLIAEKDKELSAGHSRLLQRATHLITELEGLNAGSDLPLPGVPSLEDPEKKSLRFFAFKSGLIALVIVIVLAAAAASFSYAVREPMRKVGLKIGRSAITQIEKGFREAVELELTPERRERLRLSIADSIPYLKPFIFEFKPLLVELCGPTQ